MNIFYLNSDPVVAAEKQYNKHVVKMILESAQLLCSAHHMLDSEIDVPYKLTHKNHPSAVWTRRSLQNYAWLHWDKCTLNVLRRNQPHGMRAIGIRNTINDHAIARN